MGDRIRRKRRGIQPEKIKTSAISPGSFNIQFSCRKGPGHDPRKSDIRGKIRVLEHASSSGQVTKTRLCPRISRETFYGWRGQYGQTLEKS